MTILEKDLTLTNSRTRTLFQTEAWKTAWLATWGNSLTRNTKTTLDKRGESYRIKQRLKHFIPVTSTLPVGSPARGLHSIRREYAQWTLADLQRLLGVAKDQVILNDVVVDSPAYVDIQKAIRNNNLFEVIKDSSRAYAVDVATMNYADYLKTRGTNTRLKLHNRRKRLASMGVVELINLWPDCDQFIDRLNALHRHRWGKLCFGGYNRGFIQTLLPLLHAEGHTIDLSLMKVGGQDVSLALDIDVAGRVHNVQAGYVEDFAKGISLGTLHLGYQIEKAFANPTAFRYDFMAGQGKNFDYKAALATHYCDLVDIDLVKSTWLKLLYQWRERDTRLQPEVAASPQ